MLMQRFNGSTVQRFNGSNFLLLQRVKCYFMNFCLFALNCSIFKQSIVYLIKILVLFWIVHFLFGLWCVKWLLNNFWLFVVDCSFFDRVKCELINFWLFVVDCSFFNRLGLLGIIASDYL